MHVSEPVPEVHQRWIRLAGAVSPNRSRAKYLHQAMALGPKPLTSVRKANHTP
jgi:hypothetical protein